LILLDTSGLLAVVDDSQPKHHEAAAVLAAASPPRLLSPFVLAELDYLTAKRVGQAAELALLDEVGRGVYRLEPFSDADIADARAVIEAFAALEVGLTDASLVVLARRHGTTDLLTLDERHFRTLPGPRGAPFRLLPADTA
jgi:uncharacterized protein